MLGRNTGAEGLRGAQVRPSTPTLHLLPTSRRQSRPPPRMNTHTHTHTHTRARTQPLQYWANSLSRSATTLVHTVRVHVAARAPRIASVRRLDPVPPTLRSCGGCEGTSPRELINCVQAGVLSSRVGTWAPRASVANARCQLKHHANIIDLPFLESSLILMQLIMADALVSPKAPQTLDVKVGNAHRCIGTMPCCG